MRKLAEERSQRLIQVYALLSAISTTILRAQDEQSLFDAACQIAVKVGGFAAAWIGLAPADTTAAQPVAWSANLGHYLIANNMTTDLTSKGCGPFGTAVRENRVVACNDIAMDPQFGPWRQSALALGFRAAAVFPLRRGNCVIGGFAMYSTSAGFFDSEEAVLLERLALDMSIAIELLEKQRAREEAEAARRISEETMRAVFEQAGVGICVVKHDYRFDRVNEQFCQILGYSMQELLESHTCIDTTHPDDRDGDAQAVGELLDGAQSVTLEKRYLHKTGRPVWAQLTLSALFAKKDEVRGFIGIIRDITDQKKAMEDRDRFFELSRDMLAISDFNGVFVQVNPAWTACLGWSRDELVGRHSLDFVHPEDRDRSLGARGQLAGGPPARDFENRYRCKDGSFRWVSWSSQPVPEAGQVVSSVRDVTERRSREAQLLLLETCIARMSDLVLITEADPLTDPGPRIVFANNAFLARTGYSLSEVLGKSPRMLQGPKTDRRELDRIKAALAKHQAVRSTLVNYTKKGEAFSLELDVVPVINADNQCTHFIAVERDITERIALDERLRQAERMEAVGQLTGGLAHDFNNLLAVILGNSDLLSAELGPDSPQRELAEMIGRASQRGAELTKRLLAFSRKQSLEARAVDVNIIAPGMRELLTPLLGEHIPITYALSQHPCIALVDVNQLENAVLNLCLNARDAMPDGGQLTIHTDIVFLDAQYASRFAELSPGGYVMIAVADTGMGIAAEVLGRVFEPFFTTKAPGYGTGLGLAMVFGFVKQSGGHVSIDSVPGRGTTVQMFFPIALASDAPAQPRPDDRPVLRGNESILLVEDDQDVLRFVLQQITALGYSVTIASDARAAMNIINSGQRIDLMFTDVLIPGGMNGFQLAKAARQRRPGLKVLYTSGYAAGSLNSQGRLDDDVILLQKPYRMQELARYLRRALNGDA